MVGGMTFNTFTLKNGLQVLAISDPRFVKSSAALAVMAGSMQNPSDHLGLAHFLEHMLFLGTEDFPVVGDYENYLNKNGGGHNAYTSIDHTNYFFDCTHSAFEGALQRFSRFFVNPTFDKEYVDREKNAVHSEHEKNLKDDHRREYRFLQMTTDPDHPFSLFATGDRNTLAKADRDVVMDFYKSHYSANLMRLVLMSNESGDQLQKLAEGYFQDIPNIKIEKPEFDDRLFIHGSTPKLHQVETIRDHDYLKISFDMPDDLPYWESKPTQFLAHLIGEEGEGSLLSYLKRKGWALGLETSTWWRMFHVRVHLTDEGKANYEEIIKATFSFIKLIKKKGLQKYIFNERKIMAEVELNNMEPKSSMSRASQFSASMLYFPVESFLSDYYLYHKYSPEEFNKFLSHLTTENMQVTLFSKDKVTGETEPYYGIAFRSQDLEKDLVESINSQDINPEFQYPEPNPFVPTDMKMVKPEKIYEPEQETFRDWTTIFSQVDTDLGIPKGSISVSFVSDEINGDPKNYLLAKMYVALKKEELNEWGYPVRLAGLHFGFTHGYNTITIDTSGYSQHLDDLLKDLIADSKHGRRIDHIDVEETTFQEIRKKMKKAIANREHDAAYQQLIYETGQFFSTAAVHHKDYIKFIDEMTLSKVNVFARKFFSEVSIRCFTYGNVDKEKVKPVVENFFHDLQAVGFVDEEIEVFENKYFQMPAQKYAMVLNGPNNNNGQVTLYKTDEWTIENQAYVDLLAKLLEQPFFTELRTHQQLGYVVAAFSTSSHGFCGLGTLIQSQSHTAMDCFNRAQTFLEEFLKDLPNTLNDEDVELVKQSIISELTLVPNSLRQRLSKFTSMAGTYHGDFKFYEKLAKITSEIKRDVLLEFVKNKVNLSRGSLALLYNGAGHESTEVPEGFQLVKDYQEVVKAWKRVQPYKKSREM